MRKLSKLLTVFVLMALAFAPGAGIHAQHASGDVVSSVTIKGDPVHI